MSAAGELRVPVERVEVELLLGDGRRRTGVMFVPPGTKVEELLERGTAFLPVEEEGKVRLYAPAALACVAVFGARACAVSEDALPTERRALSVRLRSGETLDGEVQFVPWGGRVRTADLLNEPAATFALFGSRGEVRHVAKAHVESVEEV
jgi:hypothetical protein